MRTRTELALHYHIDIKHNTYWDVEDEAKERLQHKPLRAKLLKKITSPPIRRTNHVKTTKQIVAMPRM